MDFEENVVKKTILVVDDEKNIVNLLVHNLQKEGYNTLECYDGNTAIDMAFNEKPDLILLDIMIPNQDGLTVCKKIKHRMNLPIILLTAKGEEIDKILGLELGADDYITKPFSVRELIARVKANIRKTDAYSNNQVDGHHIAQQEEVSGSETLIRLGELELDLEKFSLKARGVEIDLTLREFEVLKYLSRQPGQVITREMLLEKVWGYEHYGDIRTVDVTVRRIREKIEEDPTNPKLLITKRGIGYYLTSVNKNIRM